MYRSILAALLWMIFSLPSASYADFTFTVVDFPGASSTVIAGINNLGQIVGTYTDQSNKQHGFLKNGSNFTTINIINTAFTMATGINDLGHIVGGMGDCCGGGFSSFLFKDGQFGFVNAPSALTRALGINNSDRIVGDAASDAIHAFLFDGSTYSFFDANNTTRQTTFSGINNLGQIVGSFANGTLHGFLKDGANFTPFDAPLGTGGTFPNGINDAVEIVGSFIDAQGQRHGFLKRGDSFTTVDYPSGAVLTGLNGINNYGQIVGTFVDSNGVSHGFVTEALIVPVLEKFSVTDLGDLPGGLDVSIARAINNLGTVVGESHGSGDGDYSGCGASSGATKPFIWTAAGGMQALGPTPTRDFSSPLKPCGGGAFGINDQGEVAGYLDWGSGGSRAFIWNAGNGIQLIHDQAFGAADINNAGQVVGASAGGAFRWSAASGIEFLTGSGTVPWASAINNLGITVGVLQGGRYSPVFWDAAGTLRFMNGIPDDNLSSETRSLMGINDLGEIVGRVCNSPTSPLFRADGCDGFFWSPASGAQNLGELPTGGSHNTGAAGVNRSSQVVGASNGRAFLWTGSGGIRDLNTLLDQSGIGWILLSATAINDGGQIVGYGDHNGVTRAFLLTPVSTPQPLLAVNPSALDYSGVNLGSSKDLTFTVQNTGGGTLTGSVSTSAPFSIFGDNSFSLTANQTKDITVRFAPTSAANFNGTVNLTSNGGDVAVAVKGVGLATPLLTRFSVTDLGDLPGGGDLSVASAINNKGEVVGYSGGSSNSSYTGSGVNSTKPFFWSLSTGMQEIPISPQPSAVGGFASGINASGQVVGYLQYSIDRPFLWTPDNGMQLIDSDRTGYASGINNFGKVVGSITNLPSAYRWSAAGGFEFLGGIAAVHSGARSINNSGVAGGGIALGRSSPVFWDSTGTLHRMDGIPDDNFGPSQAYGLNDSGEVVGQICNSPTSTLFRAEGCDGFFWSPAIGALNIGELPTSGSHNTGPLSINNISQVVGASNDRAFVWTAADGLRDLNALLDQSGTGWTLISANSINDFGQIVGYGDHNGVTRAFLLNPVSTPEPVLAVSPPSLNYSGVNVGSSKDLTFTVQNTGGGTLTGNASTSAPFSIFGDNSFSLAANQTKDITVRFSPTSATTFNGNVSIASNAGNSSVILAGTGLSVVTLPTATWTTPPPSSVTAGQTFNVAWTATGSPTHVNVHWNPTDPLAVGCCLGGLDTTNSSTASPTVSPATLTAPIKNADGTPITSPTTVKYVVHVLNSDGSGNSAVVSMTVNPAESAPVLFVTSPPSRDFGPVTIGTTASLTFTVLNTGRGTLNGTVTTSTPFSIVGDNSFHLGAIVSKDITVRFSPTSAGPASGSVNFVSNGGNLALSVSGFGSPAVQPVSKVLFLPGLEASRLYRCENRVERQLWPTFDVNALLALMPTNIGASEPGIYTRDIIDTVPLLGPLPDFNVYKRFIEFMDRELREGWERVPYDWRLDLDRIISDKIVTGSKEKCENGVSPPTDTVDLVQIVTAAAQRSPTGRVSIVTHSNGGLLAKRLIQVLKSKNSGGLIDKLIMVAPPQLGTPDSLRTLLHGDGVYEKWGISAFQPQVRRLVRNMPGAYHLIPDRELFRRFSFDAIEFIGPFLFEPDKTDAHLYGVIGDYDELRRFLLSSPPDPRTRPVVNDVDRPEILDSNLLNEAELRHSNIDTFTPEGTLKVYQIVGRGLSTIQGVNYRQTFAEQNSLLKHDGIITNNGDGTVIVPSATAIQEAATYFVEMSDCNTMASTNRKHADILEISSVQNLLKAILVDNLEPAKDPNIDCINAEPQSTLRAIDELRLRIASPVELHAFDSSGRHTGAIHNPDPTSDLQFFEQQIPNSSYIPPHQLSLNVKNGPYTIQLYGTATGAFSLVIEQFRDDQKVGIVQYVDVPVTDKSIAHMDLETVASLPILLVDTDGDGIADAVVQPILNQIAFAIPGQNTTVRLGSLVRLDGSDSFDPDVGPGPLTYSWTKVSGPAVTLSGSTTAIPSFTPTLAGTYTFSLVVNDGQDNSAPATVKITVPILGDIDLDGDVDNNDLSRITSALNTNATGPNDLRDLNGDGRIDALDSRKLVTLCTRSRCATQ